MNESFGSIILLFTQSSKRLIGKKDKNSESISKCELKGMVNRSFFKKINNHQSYNIFETKHNESLEDSLAIVKIEGNLFLISKTLRRQQKINSVCVIRYTSFIRD